MVTQSKSASTKASSEKSSAKEARQKSLQAVLERVEKAYGKGSIMRLGNQQPITAETIKTGALSLDLALGGGIPYGRIIEIYGPESSGKTTLALHVIAELQKIGKTAAFIDAEHALDPSYAERIGVQTSSLILSQPDNGEQALDIVEMLVSSGAVDLIVVDSVAALTPKAEIEGSMETQHIGLQARLMSKALRKLTALVSKSRSTVIFINQLRMKIGVLFGNPETTTGGNALKFYSSIRMDIRRLGQIKAGETTIGNRVKVKVVKNKIAPPFRWAEFDIMYNEGISKAGDILDLAVEKNLIEKAGAWYSYKGDKIAQGREATKDFLKENPKVLDALEKEIRADSLKD